MMTEGQPTASPADFNSGSAALEDLLDVPTQQSPSQQSPAIDVKMAPKPLEPGAVRRRPSKEEQERAPLWQMALPLSMRDAVNQNQFASSTINSAQPMAAFFGTDEHTPFSLPSSSQHLLERAKNNARTFKSNYIFIIFLSSMYGLLKELVYLISMISLCLSYAGVQRIYDGGDGLRISGRLLPRQRVNLAIYVLGVLLALLAIRTILFWSLGFGGFLIVLHLVFRDRSSGLAVPAEEAKWNV